MLPLNQSRLRFKNIVDDGWALTIKKLEFEEGSSMEQMHAEHETLKKKKNSVNYLFSINSNNFLLLCGKGRVQDD